MREGELSRMESEWIAQEIVELPQEKKKVKKKNTIEVPQLSLKSRRDFNRRKEDTRVVWKHLMMWGGYKRIWKDFDQFVSDVGMTPSPNHVLSKRDFSKAHGPLNSYWKLRSRS